MLLEVGDELGHRLLADLRALGQDADAGPGVVEELEDAAVGEGHRRVAALGEALDELVAHHAERLAQEDREVLGPRAGRGGGEAACFGQAACLVSRHGRQDA